MVEEFPGNSQRAKQSAKPAREQPSIAAKAQKVDKVVQGEVVRRKKSLGRKVKETFLGGDGATVGEFVRDDILVPGLRDMFADIVTGGIERMLYGDSIRPSGRRGGSRFGAPTGRVNYGAFAQQPVGQRREETRPNMSRRARAQHDFDEILIPSRSEAEAVLDGLFAMLDQYGEVNVSTLYELVGISGNFTDERWGWTDLRGARVERARNNYFALVLPPTELLER